jgi:hypothetical protein
MPEMQPSTPSAAMPVPLDTAAALEDIDFALGCECADPALQIERWSQEARGAGGEN